MLHDLGLIGLTLFVKHLPYTHTHTHSQIEKKFTTSHAVRSRLDGRSRKTSYIRIRLYRSDEIAKQVQGRVYLVQSKREIALFALHAH